jgi:ABC-2 type transport system permease protein
LNIAFWDGRILFYTPAIALSNLILSALIAVFSASLGVMISLRAATVQKAIQTMMVVLMSPIVFAAMGIVMIGRVFPEDWRTVFETFMMEVVFAADFVQVMSAVIFVLVLVDIGLLIVAKHRFQRSRLYLE